MEWAIRELLVLEMKWIIVVEMGRWAEMVFFWCNASLGFMERWGKMGPWLKWIT